MASEEEKVKETPNYQYEQSNKTEGERKPITISATCDILL